MLLVITVVSLAVAAVSSTIAWRSRRPIGDARAARVAALAAAAGLADTDGSLRRRVADALDESPHRLRRRGRSRPAAWRWRDRFLAAGTAGSGSAGRQQRLMGAAAAMARGGRGDCGGRRS